MFDVHFDNLTSIYNQIETLLSEVNEDITYNGITNEKLRRLDSLGQLALNVLNAKKDLILSADSSVLDENTKKDLIENVEDKIRVLNKSLEKDLAKK